MTTNHRHYLDLAFQLAERNLGKTKSNPTVGAVVVKNHSIILQNGVCIYLYKPWEEIATYIKNMEGRPLASTLSLAELEVIFHQRAYFYEICQLKTPVNTTFTAQKLASYLKLSTNR